MVYPRLYFKWQAQFYFEVCLKWGKKPSTKIPKTVQTDVNITCFTLNRNFKLITDRA